MTSAWELATLVRTALDEDVGEGDRTTEWTVPAERTVTARIIARAEGVIAGTEAVLETFRTLDPRVRVDLVARDGDGVHVNDLVATLAGPARAILTGERVALNFLQHLSGIATLTRRYVAAIEGTGARILDTRKTTPGMRMAEKRAVVAGGGENHRSGLFDMVLIKENHVRAAGGIAAAVDRVRARNDVGLAVEVETTNLDEVRQALEAGVDRILLDNMPHPMLRRAVELVRSAPARVETEASGGITLETIRPIAETGVDFISVGALTHSAPALDLSLLVDLD